MAAHLTLMKYTTADKNVWSFKSHLYDRWVSLQCGPTSDRVINPHGDIEHLEVVTWGNVCFYVLTEGIPHHVQHGCTCNTHNHNNHVTWHDDVIKWKHFPRYWPFVWGLHRSPGNSPHKGQWRGALMFSLICAWINSWLNNRQAGDLRSHRASL